jgi:hypothetical protein
MMLTKHRSALLGLALAALFVSTLAATGPPAAAAARPMADNSCDTIPVFFGLHGMGEGPDGAQPFLAVSTLLDDLDKAQNAISGAVLTGPVPYMSVSATDWNTLTHLPSSLTAAVKDGETNLQNALTSYTRGCKPSQDKIVLVGYSMGAWVINKWLMEHHSEWPMIKGMLLYGDPCWSNGSDEGLARAFGATGCMPAKSYPKAGAAFRIPYHSYCYSGDGVCGGGFSARGNSLKRAKELAAAASCVSGNCAHFDYWYDGSSTPDLVQGAKAMVQWLGAPVFV